MAAITSHVLLDHPLPWSEEEFPERISALTLPLPFDVPVKEFEHGDDAEDPYPRGAPPGDFLPAVHHLEPWRLGDAVFVWEHDGEDFQFEELSLVGGPLDDRGLAATSPSRGPWLFCVSPDDAELQIIATSRAWFRVPPPEGETEHPAALQVLPDAALPTGPRPTSFPAALSAPVRPLAPASAPGASSVSSGPTLVDLSQVKTRPRRKLGAELVEGYGRPAAVASPEAVGWVSVHWFRTEPALAPAWAQTSRDVEALIREVAGDFSGSTAATAFSKAALHQLARMLARVAIVGAHDDEESYPADFVGDDAPPGVVINFGRSGTRALATVRPFLRVVHGAPAPTASAALGAHRLTLRQLGRAFAREVVDYFRVQRGLALDLPGVKNYPDVVAKTPHLAVDFIPASAPWLNEAEKAVVRELQSRAVRDSRLTARTGRIHRDGHDAAGAVGERVTDFD